LIDYKHFCCKSARKHHGTISGQFLCPCWTCGLGKHRKFTVKTVLMLPVQVKVMWPRPDAGIGPGADMTASRRSKSAGLSGFVSYMTRQDAEEALREFDGFDWGGSVLRVGWSKAVPIAAKPMFGAFFFPSTAEIAVSYWFSVSNTSKSRFSRSRSRSRDRSRSPSHHRRSRSESYSRSRSPKRRRERSRSRDHHRRDSRRHRSSSREEEVVTDTFIRAVASEVKGHDSHYEEHLRKREENNPKYAFLRKHVGGELLGAITVVDSTSLLEPWLFLL